MFARKPEVRGEHLAKTTLTDSVIDLKSTNVKRWDAFNGCSISISKNRQFELIRHVNMSNRQVKMRGTTIVNSRQITSLVLTSWISSPWMGGGGVVGRGERFFQWLLYVRNKIKGLSCWVSCARLTACGILISDFILAQIVFQKRGEVREDCHPLPGL